MCPTVQEEAGEEGNECSEFVCVSGEVDVASAETEEGWARRWGVNSEA